MADETRYSLAQLMFNDIEIIADSFKTSFKRDAEELTATNSSNPYAVQEGKETIEWEASDIDPNMRKTVQNLYDNKVRGTVASYDFDEDTGNLVEDDVLYGAYITEVSKENANKPFSIKGGAIGKKR